MRGRPRAGGIAAAAIACAGLSVAPGVALVPQVLAHAAKGDKIRAGNLSGSAGPERFNSLLRARGGPV